MGVCGNEVVAERREVVEEKVWVVCGTQRNCLSRLFKGDVVEVVVWVVRWFIGVGVCGTRRICLSELFKWSVTASFAGCVWWFREENVAKSCDGAREV